MAQEEIRTDAPGYQEEYDKSYVLVAEFCQKWDICFSPAVASSLCHRITKAKFRLKLDLEKAFEAMQKDGEGLTLSQKQTLRKALE